MMRKTLFFGVVLAILLMTFPMVYATPDTTPEHVFVKINGPITSDVLNTLKSNGLNVLYAFNDINVVAGIATESEITIISHIKFVASVSFDSEVGVESSSEVLPSSGAFGVYTWDQDMINVPTVQQEGLTGKGVYVAVLDTGLVPNWRDYFPESKIATEFGRAYLAASVNAHYNPNAWEYDTNSHGTHVTSTIIGFNVYGFYNVSGVAPEATIIPVKVLSNYGSGWDADVMAGILYVADLYKEEVSTNGAVLPPYDEINPIVISMSLGGPVADPALRMAIDYAINAGVFVVAAAGNSGNQGMDYPGAYPEVISVVLLAGQVNGQQLHGGEQLMCQKGALD